MMYTQFIIKPTYTYFWPEINFLRNLRLEVNKYSENNV